MITIKDYENLIIYFANHEVPENLKNFTEKLKVMYEEILYRDEADKKINEFHEKLKELNKNDNEA